MASAAPVSLVSFEATDPGHIGQMIWQRLPPQYRALLNERVACSRQHQPLDRRGFQSEPETFRSRYSFAYFDSMRASRVDDARAIRTITRSPGIDAYFVTVMITGSAEVIRAGSTEPVLGNAETGLVSRGSHVFARQPHRRRVPARARARVADRSARANAGRLVHHEQGLFQPTLRRPRSDHA